jgi:hypothetical protein
MKPEHRGIMYVDGFLRIYEHNLELLFNDFNTSLVLE